MVITIATVPSKAPGRTVLRVQGEVDFASAQVLATELGKVEDSPQVVADLRGVTFMDSTGLAVLVHFDLRMQSKQRAFALLVADGQVRNLLELTGLTDQLVIGGRLDELSCN
jgi:anti-sigma B factor antagonist